MFSFDGKHASEYFDKVLLAKRDMAAPSSPILQELRDKPGAYFFGVQTGIYEMEFEVFIQGTDRQDLWKRIRKANAWLKQEELKKLEFDDEPGLYYKAICVESLELDEILEYGFGTIKFIAPDPYAFGIHQKQRVNSPDVMFSRVGMRYREDGTQVTENYPVYKAGKFGQAALVEEGTTNLLTTASAPAQEEVSVEIGADYYLSTIGGSAIVEHKKVETLTKTNLDKEGIDFEQSFDNWSNGTFENTEEVNGFLRLSRTGETIHRIWDTKEEWEAEGNILDGVVGDESGRLTQILPEFTVKDDMSDAIGTRWNLYGTDASNFVTQQDGFVRFDLRDAAPPGEIGIGYYHDYRLKQQLFNFSQATILFTARTTNSGMSFWITNANKGYQFTLPNTQGKTTPFIIRIFSETKVEYYAAGQQAPSEWYSIHDDTGSPRLQFYVNQDDFGLFEIDSFCFVSQIVDLPPINNTWWTGTWESEFIDLSSVGTLENLTVRFQNEFLGTDGLTFTEFHYQLRIDGIEQEWQVLHEDYETGNFSFQIPELAKGTDLTGKEIRFKFVVYTAEPWSTDIKFLELQAISTYHTFGTWESSILDISQVGKAASTEISWVNESVPAETSVKVETQLSFDGGSTWEDYEEATNGKGIPGINQQTDLSNALLRYKAVLTTNDDTETPSIDSASIKLKTGYKASETIELSGVDVNGIGVAENSTIDLPENNGESVTSVTFEYSIDDGNTWTPMQDGQPFIQDTDLTGKTLRIRYTLATSDTNYTPNIGNSLTWLIQQQEGNKIKPVTTTISLTPVNASRWQLEKKHFATGWHNTGTREPEALMVWINHLIETWENEGAISFWFYDDGIKKQQSPIILDTSGEVYRIKVFKDENNGVYVLEIGEIEVLAAPVVTGWNHLVLTWDETNGYFYLNDSQVGTFDKEAYPLYFEDKSYLWLGSSRDKTDHLNGLIDDIALFNRKLEENEINELFQQPAQRDPNANVYHLDGNLTSDDDTSLTYEGTAKTFPKFTITFARDSSYFRVANGRDFVLVNYDFKAGDVLEIDNEMELVLLNTGPLMKAVSLDSDFFEIKHDDEIIVDPTGFANVDIEFVERWV